VSNHDRNSLQNDIAFAEKNRSRFDLAQAQDGTSLHPVPAYVCNEG
jgi:hypothetical protein